MVDNEINVLINISSVPSNIIDTRILITSIRRPIKFDSINGEFVVDAGRVPSIIADEESVRQGIHLGLTWRAHIYIE